MFALCSVIDYNTAIYLTLHIYRLPLAASNTDSVIPPLHRIIVSFFLLLLLLHPLIIQPDLLLLSNCVVS